MTIADKLSEFRTLQQKHRPKAPESPKRHICTTERGNTYQSRNRLLKEMGFESYSEYRQSDLWNAIKLRVWKEKGRLCEICRKTAQTIHHRRYDVDTLTGGTLEHLAPLCCECHEAVEFNESGRKRTHEQAEQVFLKMKFQK